MKTFFLVEYKNAKNLKKDARCEMDVSNTHVLHTDNCFNSCKISKESRGEMFSIFVAQNIHNIKIQFHQNDQKLNFWTEDKGDSMAYMHEPAYLEGISHEISIINKQVCNVKINIVQWYYIVKL